jgi:hypothetical protein
VEQPDVVPLLDPGIAQFEIATHPAEYADVR